MPLLSIELLNMNYILLHNYRLFLQVNVTTHTHNFTSTKPDEYFIKEERERTRLGTEKGGKK